MSQPPTQTLTPSIKTSTKVPFPKRPPITKDGGLNVYSPQLGADGEKKITIETCSELLKRKFALDLFSVRQDNRADGLAIIHDKTGQPVLFSIGSDHCLYMLAFVNNSTAGWQKFNITPPAGKGRKLVDFDVAQFGSTVYVAVAVPAQSSSDNKSDDEVTHSIWHCSFPVLELSASQSGRGVIGFASDALKWIETKNNLGAKRISTVVCGTGASIEGSAAASTSGIWLGIGTAATKSEPTANYIVDLSSGVANPWEAVPTVIPANESKSICPIMTGNSQDDRRVPGVASLLKRSSDGSSGIYVDTFTGPQRNRIPKQLLSGTLGETRSFYASQSAYGPHDIFAASHAGVGFYPFENLGQEPTILLPGIPIRQVSCAEVPNDQYENNQDIYARLSVLAVSETDDLYFIQGVRRSDGQVYFDAYSGLPIRRKVQKMSAQYNYGCRSTEILYTSQDHPNELHHLVRDPHTTLWSETQVTIRAFNEKPTFVERSVYVTTITITDGANTPVPDGYPVMITGGRVAVTVDSGHVFLSEREAKIETSGGNGQIMITALADELIGAAEYKLQLKELVPAGSEPAKLTVQPSQRVLRLMSNVKGTDDLSKITDKNGSQIFAGVDGDKLSKMAGVVGAVNEVASPQENTSNKSPTTVTTGSAQDKADLFDKHPTTHTSSRSGGFFGWVGDAIDSTVHFFGDVIEAVKQGIKDVIKAGLQVLGKALKFVVQIGGKIFSFAMKGIGLVLKGASACLKLIGVDTSKLDAWLSYLFDGDSTEQTQKVLETTVRGCIRLSQRFLAVNRDSVKDLFVDGRSFLKQYIDDPRSPSEKAEGQKDSVLMKILNNPIVKTLLSFNPLSWLIEAIAEGLEESGFKTPNLQKFLDRIAKHTGTGIDTIVNALTSIVGKLANSIGDLASDPSKVMSILSKALSGVFWDLFDAVESLSLNIYDLIMDLFDLIIEFLTGEWQIPGITDAWVEFTGQQFTLLGFATYISAAVLNLGSMLSMSRLPFKNISVFNDWEQLPVPQLYKSSTKTTSSRVAATASVAIPMKSVKPQTVEKVDLENQISQSSLLLARQDSKNEFIPSKPHIMHQEVAGGGSSNQGQKARKLAISMVGAIGEIFTFLAAAKEIFHLADFSEPLKGGKSTGKDMLPNVRKDQPAPQKGALNIFYNMTHLSALAFAIVSTSCNLTCMILKLVDEPPPVSFKLLVTSGMLSFIGAGMFAYKHDAAGGMLQQVASGTAIVADWTNGGWHADHWPDHALEVTHFVAACTGLVGIIAGESHMEQVAVVCGVLDMTLSTVGGAGEVIVGVTEYVSH